MNIRRATPDDAEALVRIHADMGAYYAELEPTLFHDPDLTGFAPILAAEITEDVHALQLVAEIDGEVVGSLDARLLLPPDEARFAFTRDLFAPRLRIEYLATAAAHRRGGVGTALVEAAETWGREHGATVSELTTYHASPLSMPFWTRRAGYAERSVNLRKVL